MQPPLDTSLVQLANPSAIGFGEVFVVIAISAAFVLFIGAWFAIEVSYLLDK